MSTSKIKTFSVEITETTSYVIEVSAKDIHAAIQYAQELLDKTGTSNLSNPCNHICEIISAKEIRED